MTKSAKPEDTYSVWDGPGVMLDSQWGRVTYRAWCKQEAERLGKKGKFVEIIEWEDGEIALAEIKKEVTEE